MPDSKPDLACDAFRYDLVAYLAQRFGVSNEAALSALGDWLVSFEPKAGPLRRNGAPKLPRK